MARRRQRQPEETRRKLVEATVCLVIDQGFNATSIDQICAAADVTKGSFFHHFPNKDAIGEAAIMWWSEMGTNLYAEAWKDSKSDPLEQLHAMLDIMDSFTRREGEACRCLIGMMSQELAETHPDIRESCARELTVWTDNVARLLREAKQTHNVKHDFDPEQVAWFLNSLWQGSMLIAKNRLTPEMIRDNLRIGREYIDSLFE